MGSIGRPERGRPARDGRDGAGTPDRRPAGLSPGEGRYTDRFSGGRVRSPARGCVDGGRALASRRLVSRDGRAGRRGSATPCRWPHRAALVHAPAARCATRTGGRHLTASRSTAGAALGGVDARARGGQGGLQVRSSPRAGQEPRLDRRGLPHGQSMRPPAVAATSTATFTASALPMLAFDSNNPRQETMGPMATNSIGGRQSANPLNPLTAPVRRSRSAQRLARLPLRGPA